MRSTASDAAPTGGPLPVWKMDMLVLLMPYPVVFLFGHSVGAPPFDRLPGFPLALFLFLGNIVSVALTGFLVPWVAGRFGWWLRPAPGGKLRIDLMGAAFISALYAAMVLLFLHLF